MKVNITNVLLATLVVILLWQNFFKKKEVQKPVPITVTMPEQKGSTGQRVIERVVTQPIYLPSSGGNVDVDSKWKAKYELAKDSLERANLYLEAIKVNKYEKVLVDNDSIKVKGFATTRGSLLDYTVDYTIKPNTFSYKPKVIKELPKLLVGFGVDVGVPTFPNVPFKIRGNLNFVNGKGNGVSLGYDNQKTIWLGVSKNIKLIK